MKLIAKRFACNDLESRPNRELSHVTDEQLASRHQIELQTNEMQLHKELRIANASR